jgi:hypothetical protein
MYLNFRVRGLRIGRVQDQDRSKVMHVSILVISLLRLGVPVLQGLYVIVEVGRVC